MSDFDNEMYTSGEEIFPTKPQLISQQKVSVTSLGKMTSVTIDGKQVFIVDPATVNQLIKRLEIAENDLRDQTIKTNRALNAINAMQAKIADLERNMGRIFND